jgi:uncharacterized membrane protein
MEGTSMLMKYILWIVMLIAFLAALYSVLSKLLPK